jgi:hypothetical protein
MIRANGQRLCRLGSITPSTTTRIISTAGNTNPGTASPFLKPKRNAKTAAVKKTATIPIPKNELGTVTLAYGISQKGIPAMKKHNRNAPVITFFGFHKPLFIIGPRPLPCLDYSFFRLPLYMSCLLTQRILSCSALPHVTIHGLREYLCVLSILLHLARRRKGERSALDDVVQSAIRLNAHEVPPSLGGLYMCLLGD